MDNIEAGIRGAVKNTIDDLNGINTLALAKIVRVDNENLEADILRIAMTEFMDEFDDNVVIENVPIMPIFNSSSFFVNAPYNVGDLVIVGFCLLSLVGVLDL